MGFDSGGGTGPFAPYPVTGALIRTEADTIMSKFAAVEKVYTETSATHRSLFGSIQGFLVESAAGSKAALVVTKSDINDQATYAAATARAFGDRVDEYNDTKTSSPRAVRYLNTAYTAATFSAFGVSPVAYPPGATQQERSELDGDYDAAVASKREQAQADLRAEYHQLQQWIEDRGNEIAAMLDRGPNESDILELWQTGALPSWANLVYPQINFTKVQIDQLPYDLRSLNPDELKKIADGVAIKTLKAYIEAEIEIASWEAEGKAEATYKVMADGTVVMSLVLEAGLGREIAVAGSEVDASAGLTTELELTFDSPEEAQAFLDGLDDAAFDLGWGDLPVAPAAVAHNVASYVLAQDVTGFKGGIYGKASAEFESSYATGEAEGRLDAYYDFVKQEYGVKVAAALDAELGQAGSGYSGSAKLEGEMIFDNNEDFQSLTLSGTMSGAVANQKLGLDIPNTSTAQGVDVRLKITKEDPGYEQIADAASSGDMDKAAELAIANGQVVVRQTTTEILASEEKEYKIFGQGAEVEYGASAEYANIVWVRQPGTNYFVPIHAGTTE